MRQKFHAICTFPNLLAHRPIPWNTMFNPSALTINSTKTAYLLYNKFQ
jgi:hypothetical protein